MTFCVLSENAVFPREQDIKFKFTHGIGMTDLQFNLCNPSLFTHFILGSFCEFLNLHDIRVKIILLRSELGWEFCTCFTFSIVLVVGLVAI